MGLERLIARDEAILADAFEYAFQQTDKSFLKPEEVDQLRRVATNGWIREAIVIFLAARFLSIHFHTPDLTGLAEVILDLMGQEPALTSERSTPLVVAIAHTLAVAAWRVRAHLLEVERN